MPIKFQKEFTNLVMKYALLDAFINEKTYASRISNKTGFSETMGTNVIKKLVDNGFLEFYRKVRNYKEYQLTDLGLSYVIGLIEATKEELVSCPL